jgi:hypothetical protein
MKTRILKFASDEEREMFPMLYAGFMNGGNGPQAKGMEVTRREVRILDKLDAVSEDNEVGDRVLKSGSHDVVLEQPEFELLKRYFENTPWTTKVARQVVNISDWLAAIQLEENGG